MRVLLWTCVLGVVMMTSPAAAGHHEHGYGSKTCAVQEKLQTCLCSGKHYEVRRMRRSVWVSTTVWDDSLASGSARAQQKLSKYLNGHNNKGSVISMELPTITQTYVPTDMREVTVSYPLPEEKWNSPPMPKDPKVVLDVIPETIMYVRSFPAQPGKTRGFLAEREAQKLFKSLSAHGEPVMGDNDYYYVLQYDSAADQPNEVAVFATNSILDEFYRSPGLDPRRYLPACLREKGPEWPARDDVINVDLVRQDCGTTFCTGDICPKYNLLNKDDIGVETRVWEKMGPLLYTIAPTCQFEQAHKFSQPLMHKYLQDNGVLPPDAKFSRFTPIGTGIWQLEPHQGACSRAYETFAFIPPALDGKLPEGESGYVQKYSEANITADVMCYGGHGEPKDTLAVSRRLFEHVEDRDVCWDYSGVIEYNVQSRLFDRHNEAVMPSLPDGRKLCYQMEESDQPFKVNYDLPEDWYTRPESADRLLPLFRCGAPDSPNCAPVRPIRQFGHFTEMRMAESRWVCTEETSHTGLDSFDKGLNRLLSYINGNNDAAVRMETTLPILTIMKTAEGNTHDPETLKVCSYLAKQYQDNPPKPMDAEVYLTGPVGETDLYATWYEVKDMKDFDEILGNLFDKWIPEMASMAPFFNITFDQNFAVEAQYFEDSIEPYLGFAVLFKQVPPEFATFRTDEETKAGRAECGEFPCVHETVKEFDGFSEIKFNDGKLVCWKSSGCGAGNGRQAHRAVHRYVNGHNVEEVKVSDVAPPVYTECTQLDASCRGPSCERKSVICMMLPAEYKDKDAPTPIDEGLAVSEEGLPDVYVTKVERSGNIGNSEVVNAYTDLLTKLQKNGIPAAWGDIVQINYITPYNPYWQGVRYIGVRKPGESSE